MHILRNLRYHISVYEGISPSLLATMSLSHSIRGTTHDQLITSLRPLIGCEHTIGAMRAFDRQLFTAAANPYQNTPYPISGGEMMSDVFTHATILAAVVPYLSAAQHILDIGTGHGYLAFALNHLCKALAPHCHITAIDSHPPAIDYCQSLQRLIDHEEITFQCREMQQIDGSGVDVIVGGFYIESRVSEQMHQYVRGKAGRVGVWPTDGERGQALYLFTRERKYIMDTMFSMPCVGQRTEVCSQETTLEKRARRKQQLQEQLKGKIERYKQQYKRMPSLQQMQKIQSMKSILDELYKMK